MAAWLSQPVSSNMATICPQSPLLAMLTMKKIAWFSVSMHACGIVPMVMVLRLISSRSSTINQPSMGDTNVPSETLVLKGKIIRKTFPEEAR